MDELFEQFPDKETFDTYWKENYKPLCYEDVKEAFEEFVISVDKKIFDSDYEAGGCINKDDFAENLSQTAEFTFQDTLTEVFYEKNPDLYETAFALYEAAQMTGQGNKNVAQTFHEEYNRLYIEFLNEMFGNLF